MYMPGWFSINIVYFFNIWYAPTSETEKAGLIKIYRSYRAEEDKQ